MRQIRDLSGDYVIAVAGECGDRRGSDGRPAADCHADPGADTALRAEIDCRVCLYPDAAQLAGGFDAQLCPRNVLAGAQRDSGRLIPGAVILLVS